jgi:hypothetical protein
LRDFWNRRSRTGKGLIVVGLVLVGLIVLGLLAPSEDESGDGDESPAAAETTTTATAPSEETSRCVNVPPATVRAIADGLTTSGRGSLRFAHAVEADADEDFRGVSMPLYLVSADIQAPGLEGSDEIATWVLTRSLRETGIGLIVAVDSIASEFSEWGEAANEGSPVDEWRDGLRDDDAYDESRDCVEEQG